MGDHVALSRALGNFLRRTGEKVEGIVSWVADSTFCSSVLTARKSGSSSSLQSRESP